MFATILDFLVDESGATAIEYAFIAGLVSIASFAAWDSLGSSVNAAFESVSSDVGMVAANTATVDGTVR